MNFIEKIRWTCIGLCLLGMEVSISSAGSAQADELQQKKIEACLGQVTGLLYLHKMLKEGFQSKLIMDELNSSYSGWQLEVSINNLSWAMYYRSNTPEFLEGRFYKACMDASEGPFNMKGPEG